MEREKKGESKCEGETRLYTIRIFVFRQILKMNDVHN